MAAGQETVLDDYAFLVSETDSKGIIKFANNDFCNIAEFTLDELLDQPHSMVRHKDMPRKAFKSLWDTVQKGQIWTGYVKNATKSGGYYWVYATVYPFESCDGSQGFMSCRRKASKQEIAAAEDLYRQWNKEEGR
ncbi:PAS domain-containing protein [Poseidonibacter lekithochrous]|uniref:PAS domain-containing protein n=1 Tax=Poseidonibacter lekithochrous TaxID=1904463 RepID=UPI0008FC202A|nr:PAS domain-containing protein [Poseidonibacter lekithochrous]QKJ23968.1 PAS sensor-containing signal transduction protein [Poseidonibacter lekithochrous]